MRVLRDRLGVQVGGIGVETGTRFENIGNQQADGQREGGDHFEVQQRLAAHAADLLDVLHARDAGDHGTEDHGGDDHLDQLDEAVAQRFHVDGVRRVEHPQQHAGHDGEQHLHVQDFIEWFFHEWSPLAG